jgi:type VI secretion system protein ImpF
VADLLPAERLQPCLLDRLTDDEPSTQKEGRDQRVMTVRRYRQAVLRDLAWLLNSGNMSSVQDISEYDEVQSSVLNFGMPDLCGMTASGIDPRDVEERMAKAIRDFEPRIMTNTLVVRAVADPNAAGGSNVSFEIEGELWAKPMHEALFIKTELDLETGDFKLKEGGR